MPERRTPWIAIDVDIRKDDRVVDLPSDAARYGYVAGVLAEARLQSPRGVYGSRATLAEAIGRFDRFTPQYLEVGLLELVPKLCGDCKERYGQLKSGAIVVHNWHRKQHDPTHAERMREHRARRAGDGDSDGDVTVQNGTPASLSDDEVTVNVTAKGRPAHARAPRHQTQTLDTTEGIPSSRVTPREPKAPEASAILGIEPDDVRWPVAAILSSRYRWRQVSEAQWDQLYEEVDNEYPSGTKRGVNPADGWRWLAGWLADLPRDAGEPMAALFARQQRLKAEREAEAEDRIRDSEQHKRARLHPSLGGTT